MEVFDAAAVAVEERKSLFEPFAVKLGEKEYKVEKVTTGMGFEISKLFGKVDASSSEQQEDAVRIVSILLDLPLKDLFKEDMATVLAASNFLSGKLETYFGKKDDEASKKPEGEEKASP